MIIAGGRLSERFVAPYLEHYGVLPLELADGRCRVATWHDEPDPQALDDLRLVLGADLELVRVPEEELRPAIQRVYGAGSVTAEGMIAGLAGEEQGVVPAELALDDLVSLANEAPVIKLVNLLLLEALESRASDVHLEAYADVLRVRYRIDGVLQDTEGPPKRLQAAYNGGENAVLGYNGIPPYRETQEYIHGGLRTSQRGAERGRRIWTRAPGVQPGHPWHSTAW